MASLTELLHNTIADNAWIQAVLSQPKAKGGANADKVKIKPVMLGSGLHYQFISYAGPKVLHENVTLDQTPTRAEELILTQFKQTLLQTSEADYHILVNKKGEPHIMSKKATKIKAELAHNRKKKYLLEEGESIPFLIELGVMNAQGKVLASKFDKFRQINRFLEMIDDVASDLPQDRTVRIVDFGCGKSYLTFALYHYLKEMRKLDLQVVGLDLKEDVIQHCNALARSLGYEQLHFIVGDISKYDEFSQVDMVVTLHACDTATDAALNKAVRWGAGIILSVPCCQHELYNQVKNEALAPLLKHGILKERFASLATDAARAQLLELVGYKTQVLEFIDMEHTPKNLLIRAVKDSRADEASANTIQPRKPVTGKALLSQAAAYRKYVDSLGISPYLERALADRLEPLMQSIE